MFLTLSSHYLEVTVFIHIFLSYFYRDRNSRLARMSQWRISWRVLTVVYMCWQKSGEIRRNYRQYKRENMEVRKICQWCGKPFVAQKTTTCYCSHQCSNLGCKERIWERKRQLKRSQELLQARQAAEGQDFFSFAQAAKLMGVTRQYIY